MCVSCKTTCMDDPPSVASNRSRSSPTILHQPTVVCHVMNCTVGYQIDIIIYIDWYIIITLYINCWYTIILISTYHICILFTHCVCIYISVAEVQGRAHPTKCWQRVYRQTLTIGPVHHRPQTCCTFIYLWQTQVILKTMIGTVLHSGDATCLGVNPILDYRRHGSQLIQMVVEWMGYPYVVEYGTHMQVPFSILCQKMYYFLRSQRQTRRKRSSEKSKMRTHPLERVNTEATECSLLYV